MDIEQLRGFQDYIVVIRLLDGETLKSKVVFVDLEYEDIIIDVLETNRPEHYKDPNASYTVRASDIVSVEKVGLGRRSEQSRSIRGKIET